MDARILFFFFFLLFSPRVLQHTSYVHLVDARTFTDQQIIKVPMTANEPDARPDICGLTFTPDGRTLFVGTNSIIAEYDIDLVTRRCFPDGSLN